MRLLLLVLLCISTQVFAGYKAEYPKTPEISMTPGSLCTSPSSYRYQERIPYCNRDVDSQLKDEVFREYRNAGYRLTPGTRSSYKIDHFIPLCAGGSNRENNLWPQHKSVYELTDPIEFVGCQKLKDGRIKQAELIDLIVTAKRDLSQAREVLDYLNHL